VNKEAAGWSRLQTKGSVRSGLGSKVLLGAVHGDRDPLERTIRAIGVLLGGQDLADNRRAAHRGGVDRGEGRFEHASRKSVRVRIQRAPGVIQDAKSIESDLDPGIGRDGFLIEQRNGPPVGGKLGAGQQRGSSGPSRDDGGVQEGVGSEGRVEPEHGFAMHGHLDLTVGGRGFEDAGGFSGKAEEPEEPGLPARVDGDLPEGTCRLGSTGHRNPNRLGSDSRRFLKDRISAGCGPAQEEPAAGQRLDFEHLCGADA
jgi:hypothetical protein